MHGEAELDRRGPCGLDLSTQWGTIGEGLPPACVYTSGSRRVSKSSCTPFPSPVRRARGCSLLRGRAQPEKCRSPPLPGCADAVASSMGVRPSAEAVAWGSIPQCGVFVSHCRSMGFNSPVRHYRFPPHQGRPFPSLVRRRHRMARQRCGVAARPPGIRPLGGRQSCCP